MHKIAANTRREKKEALEREQQKIEEMKKNNPEEYGKSLLEKKKSLQMKLEEIKTKKNEFTDRSSAASMRRMQLIASLGITNEKVYF